MSAYKGFVGPHKRWDLIAGHVFTVLYERGLREHHKVLDIGCGSLRVGRLLIPYLAKGNYYGFDPNEKILQQGLINEVGSLLVLKKVNYYGNADKIPVDWMDKKFNYIFAHSIFTHAPVWMIRKYLIESYSMLNKGGYFISSFMKGIDTYIGEDWVYPGCCKYPRIFLENIEQEDLKQGFTL